MSACVRLLHDHRPVHPPPPVAAGTLSTQGRWWASGDLGVQGAHVTLLREPQGNFAKVFLFGGSGSQQVMKVWRFNPLANTSWIPNRDSLGANNGLFTVPHPNNRLVDLFCGGHTTLSDGRLLLIGGQWAPTDPCQLAWAFDPHALPDTGYAPWSQMATMAVDRWYPTATALADGRVLASGGESRVFMLTFGGDSTSGRESRVLHPLAMAGRFNWSDTTATPDAFGVTNGKFPPAREDHALVGDRKGRAYLFGGRTGTPGAYTYFNDVWTLIPSGFAPTQDDSTFRWSKCKVLPDPVNGLPKARARFAATWSGLDAASDGNPTQLHRHTTGPQDSAVIYIHGGLDSLDHPLGDLWRGWQVNDSSAFWEWQWQKLRDDPSTARYGHTMVYDPGPVTGLSYPDYSRLLMFGGRDSAGLSGNSVLACRVASWSLIQQGWQQPTMTSGPYGTPAAREGHVAVMQVSRLNNQRRMYMFGGQDGSGAPADTALWYLARSDGALSDTVYQWARTPRTGGPSGRTRSTAVWFDDGFEMVLFGGDTNGSASGEYTDEVWAVQLHPSITDYGKWTRVSPRQFSHPNAPALTGAASYVQADGIATRALEVLDPMGTSSSGSGCASLNGKWTTVTSQDSISARRIALYPQLYVLPDGRLFHAGPAPAENHPYKRFFNLSSKQWEDSTSQAHYDAIVFGSSVMYRPGKILRAGRHGEGGGASGSDRTETIDIAAGTIPGWQVYEVHEELGHYQMLPRANQNLTVLPTGDVLATGGRAGTDSSTAQRKPQIWKVAIGGWNNPDNGDSLVSDPKPRNYHSAAILLPDGRVLTSGGEGERNDSKYTASIYEPPYLFRSDDSYASRPTIQGAPEKMLYGVKFTLYLAVLDSNRVNTIKSIGLIRPGSATHAFDQNQRYVPLGFVAAGPPKRLLVNAPADSFLAPPGEYMLFVVDSLDTDAPRVPSLAKWEVVSRGAGTFVDSLDEISPRGGNYLALSDTTICPNLSANLYLVWTAPADDDTIAFSGQCTAYNLRYKLNSSSEANFNAWTAIATGTPGPLGTRESVTVPGLSAVTWYRFQLKAVGDHADTSSLSNAVVAKPIYCEDDGDGFSARASGAGSFSAQSGGASSSGNSTFPGVPAGVSATDALHFEGAPRSVAGTRLVTLREGRGRGLSLDRVRLLAVDHARGTEVTYATDGRFVSGIRVPATAVRDEAGRDLLAAATGSASEPVYADSGAILSVALPDSSATGVRFLLLETAAGGGPNEGVAVETSLGSEVWTSLVTIHPRRHWSTLAVPLGVTSSVRLRFRGAHALRYVGLLGEASLPTPQEALLLGATSGSGADWTDEARLADGTNAVVQAGDTLSMSFQDVGAEGSDARDWFLILEGMPVSPSVAAYLSRRARDEHQVPTSFRLYQNVPNPFQHGTRIAFDLPRGGTVKLEVFDTQGRRVWAHGGRYEPGKHLVEWDLRDRAGHRAAPGIYSYRLVAGPNVAVRKLVVLP